MDTYIAAVAKVRAPRWHQEGGRVSPSREERERTLSISRWRIFFKEDAHNVLHTYTRAPYRPYFKVEREIGADVSFLTALRRLPPPPPPPPPLLYTVIIVA